MPDRHLPVRPDLDQLKQQAKELLRELRQATPDVKLAEAQHALARSYGVPSWPRLVHACQLIDAIWEDDLETLQRLIARSPALLHQPARGGAKDNWGPPMSYAANLGRDRIIRYLHAQGATDLEHAIDRAVLQGRIDTAMLLHGLLGNPTLSHDLLGGAAYTINAAGTEFALQMGAPVIDAQGARLAPVNVLLESDSRKPGQKHRILELYEQYGLKLPDTPPMAVHRGRIDLLEQHLARDPELLTRTYALSEIFPAAMGCIPTTGGWPAIGSPLDGVTLLHLAIEYDEIEIVRWLLANGMDVNARAAIDADGFGGQTALFGTVVSYPNFWNPQSTQMAQILLDHGADHSVRASLRHEVGWGGKGVREYRHVTPIEWGEQFIEPRFVSQAVIALIRTYSTAR
jgi:hypothetical protein